MTPPVAAQPPQRSTWRRRAVPTLGLLVLLFIGLLLAGWLYLHHRLVASVAPLDGTLHLPGLSGPVTVRRDAQGVPHMEAGNVDDLLMAQGWVTASDRLWQMDMARRLPAGEAAEVLGAKLVPHDRAERIKGIRDVADRMIRTMPPEQLGQLEAYARGVNAYIAQGNLPAEFALLMYKPQPWRPKDSILIALSMAEMLDERWQTKLKREQLTARLAAHGEAALAADLYPTGSWRDHPPVPSTPAIGDPQVVPQIPLDPSQVRVHTPIEPVGSLLALADMGENGTCAGCRPGSNEWAVSGAHTASGKPLLSNDMHLEHGIPDLWYESELHAGAFHVAGVTVPGLPFLSAGHNDHIAWGFTALGGDTQDIYVEQVNARGEYRVLSPDGTAHWQALSHQGEVIRVRGGQDVELDVQRTAHGPVISSLLPGEQRTLALHWSIYDAQAAGLPLYALDSASDWKSFEAALATWWAPTLNVVYADDAGHIGYQAVGLIPIRAGGLQAMPITPGVTQAALPAKVAGPDPSGVSSGIDGGLNGTTSPTSPLPVAPPAELISSVVGEWTGYVAPGELPSVLDPEVGIVATANARVTPDGYPHQLTLDWASPYRNERIWKWLAGKNKLTPEDMLRLQTDVFSEVDQDIAQRLAYAVDHAAHPSARARAAADLLRSWDGVLGVNSPAAAIAVATEDAFWPAALGAKVGDGWRLYDWSEGTYAREQLITRQPAAWLPPAYGSWNDFLAALVNSAVQHAPSDLRTWHFGEVHTIEIEHPLWKLVPGIPAGIGPLPQSGDPTTVKQVTGGLGPSQRFTADLGDLDRSTENIVMGQSGDPLSPEFRNQWAEWYGGMTAVLPFSPGSVQTSARHTLRLLP